MEIIFCCVEVRPGSLHVVRLIAVQVSDVVALADTLVGHLNIPAIAWLQFAASKSNQRAFCVDKNRALRGSTQWCRNQWQWGRVWYKLSTQINFDIQI